MVRGPTWTTGVQRAKSHSDQGQQENTMNKTEIDISGAHGTSGSSVKIYETPNYNYPWHGARVMHGSFTAKPTSIDDQHVEIVELCMPGLDICVAADSVRPELRALLVANGKWEAACYVSELQPARHQAFANLQSAVFSVAAREITVTHIEQIAHKAFEDGIRHGIDSAQSQFRKMLGL